MTTAATNAQTGKAKTEKKTFSRETSISVDIHSDPSIIWKLLTGAPDFPRWNSTVISIDGRIAEGQKIKLISTLAPKRVFTLKVTEVKTNECLVWGDGQGTRIYTLVKKADGTTAFSMSEKIGSFMFPLYAKYIPPFDEYFEQFTADLKKEAETIQNIKK